MITRIDNGFSDKRFRIEYMLGNLCNHKCSYCFPGSNEGDHPWPDKDLVKKNLGHLIEKYKDAGRTDPILYLIGGEPTLWKDLGEVCKYFKEEHGCDIRISTNGSRSRRWWDKNAQYFNAIEMSVHHEFAKVEHLKEVADLIYAKNVFVVANVLMDPSNFNRCAEIISQMQESHNPWPILAKAVHFDGVTFYNDNQKQYLEERIKRYPDELWYKRTGTVDVTKLKIKLDSGEVIETEGDQWPSINNLNKFKGFKCNIGLEQVKIFQDGTIGANCRQKIYGEDIPYNLYDSKFQKNFHPDFSPITCEKNICSCKSEIAVTKWML